MPRCATRPHGDGVCCAFAPQLVILTAGRVLVGDEAACFSSAADSSVNWMLSGTARPDTLLDLPPSEWCWSTSRGVGGGAGGVVAL